MSKRAREDEGRADRQPKKPKKPKRDDASNPKMTNKDRYEGNNGYFCPEWFKAFDEAARLNDGVLPASIALNTSDYYHMNVWSPDNLPDILFYIKEPQVGRVQPVNVDGQMLLPQIVPQHIAIDTAEWKIGAWLRLDPTISLKDIRARMHDDLQFIGGPLKKPSHSTLNNRMYRKCARIFGHLNGSKAKNQQSIIAEVLSPERIARNTILDPIMINGELRLVKKRMVCTKFGTTSTGLVNVDVTESNYMETTFPYDYFLIDADDDAATPALTEGLSSEASDVYDDPATPAEDAVAATFAGATVVPAQKQPNHISDPLAVSPSFEESTNVIVAEVGEVSTEELLNYVSDPSTTLPSIKATAATAVTTNAEVPAEPARQPRKHFSDPSSPYLQDQIACLDEWGAENGNVAWPEGGDLFGDPLPGIFDKEEEKDWRLPAWDDEGMDAFFNFGEAAAAEGECRGL